MKAWPVAIFVFFAVIFTVNGVIVHLAYSSKRGLIEDNPYEVGIHYQKTIDALENGVKLAWNPALKIGDLDENGMREVAISVSGSSIERDITKIELLAKRAESDIYDVFAVLDRNQENPETFSSQLKLPLSGLWLVQLDIHASDTHYIWKFREFL